MSDFYLNKVVDGIPYLTRTRDLSVSGVYLHRLIEPRPPATAQIALEFALPGTDEVIWTDVVLVRADGDEGFALEFRSLTPRVRRILTSYLARCLPSGEDSQRHIV